MRLWPEIDATSLFIPWMDISGKIGKKSAGQILSIKKSGITISVLLKKLPP